MIPNPNEVSAFAVYSGQVGMTKSRQRRNRQKRLESVNMNKINGKSSGLKRYMKAKKTSDSSPKANQSVKIMKIISESKPNDIEILKGSKKASNKSLNIASSDESHGNGLLSIKNSKKTKKVDSLTKSSKSPVKSKNLKRKQIKMIDEGSPPCEVSDRSFEIIESSDDEIPELVEAPSSENAVKKAKRKKAAVERIMAARAQSAEKRKILKQEVKKQMKGKPATSSLHKGKTVFESLISPYKAEEFFSEYWEKKPLYIERGGDSVFSQYLSTAEMDTMLRYNMLLFGRNIDITSYTDGVRETHNPEGRAHPHVVWDYYSNGCSVRILNPQTYLNKIHTLLAALQEYFGCFVGSNIYLTPAGTQGFAPHYDDIEAFVLQVEGSKRWRVYKPINAVEVLPRYSSPNFNQEEIGTPILDIILRPGDLLYFPRGYIHQAEALPDEHSLHITISTYQKTTWLDLIEQALPVALARASEENIDYRRGLPIGYLKGAGLAYPSSSLRSEMISKLRKLVFHLEKHLDIDDAVDKLGVTFVHQSLPPVLSKDEAECSVHNGGLKMNEGKLLNRVDLSLETKIRWIRANSFRIVEDREEVDQVRLYHSVDNSKEYEAEDAQFVVIDKELVPALLHLVKSYPAYISVSQLPCSTDDEKLALAGDLWDRGLVVSDYPLEPSEED